MADEMLFVKRISGMTAALKLNLVSIEDYLVGELDSPVKHEYLGGVVYAMAGARNVHNLIASNVLIAVGGRLKGKRCRAYNSDTKIRIHLSNQVRFYYPDVPVICVANPPDDSFQDQPAVIFEVVSNKTRRIDEGEKKDAYLNIPSLSVYVLVEQDTAALVVFRRTATGFVREVYTGLDAVLPLGEIEIVLPLAEIYDGVAFSPEASNDAAV
jgi:Uma2 family endonuclease